MESLEGSNGFPLDPSLLREVPTLDLHLDHIKIEVPENLEMTGCRIGRQAFMTPSVGSREVQVLSRTTWYVASEVKPSLLIATTRTTDMIQMLKF